jgi:RimJ/RimL family protein N-acetyltransferase
VRYSDEHGGFYELNPFPGCNQLVVSNHAWVAPENRGKGLGTVIHGERLAKMRILGYDYAICTVRCTNEPQICILKNAGWKKLDDFLNRETGHCIELWGKKLREEMGE